MTSTPKISVTYMEDPDLVTRIDTIADSEGLKRADILRRAVRRYLSSLPSGSFEGSVPSKNEHPAEPIAK